jgi:hypothetical protein
LLQASVNAEAKNKEEVMRVKKKLSHDLLDLQLELQAAKRTNSDLNNNVKKLQSSVAESQAALDEQERTKVCSVSTRDCF